MKDAARTTLRRLLLLSLSLAAGVAIGLLGRHFTGSSAWFLAVPAAVIAAWFAVANPDECLPPGKRPPHDGAAGSGG